MTARTVGFGAPFRWLMKAVDVGRRNPGALFGGFALLLVVGLVPSAVQMGAQYALAGSPTLMWSVYGLATAVSLLAMPPLMGAAFRLLHRCETGLPASAFDLFDGYRDTGFAVRMVQTALVLMLLYLLLFALLFVFMPGKEFFVEAISRSMATPPGAQPDMSGMPALDPSSVPLLLVWMLAMMAGLFVMTHGYMLTLVQAALGGRGPLEATASGFAATFRNLLPLFGFTLAMMVIGFVIVLVLVLVMALLGAVLVMVNPILAAVVLLPIYLAAALVAYVVMFGFYYHAWREIFGEPADAPLDAIVA